MKKLFFISMTVLLFIVLCGGIFFYLKQDISYEGYDSIGGVQVTKENICDLVSKAPAALEKRVCDWFNIHPKAYDILIKQAGSLLDTGNIICNVQTFFRIQKIENLGNFNYVFKIPGEAFFVKVCGVLNRFIYSVHSYNIPGMVLYLRGIEKKFGNTFLPYYPYMDFQQDKERIKKYFYVCCSQDILQQKASKKQIGGIINLLAGAFPQGPLRGFLYDCLIEKYRNRDFSPKTVAQAFDQMLDFASLTASYRCYNKKQLIGKKFIDTYNIANRVFARARFVEAIDKFGLDKLEKPPQSYLISVNPQKIHSCIDKDVVLVQYPLENHRPFKFYLERPKLLNIIFTQKVFGQLLQAMAYAGLWDINGENIQVNIHTHKVTYIDFEPNNEILPYEIFNKSERRRRINLCYLMLEFIKRFKVGTPQRKAVDEFMRNNKEIDFNWYMQEDHKKNEVYLKSGFEFTNKLTQSSKFVIPLGPLGQLLYYDDPTRDKLGNLRKRVLDVIWG